MDEVRKKILIVTSNLNIGGAQRFIINFANDLNDKYHVKILAIQNDSRINLKSELEKNIEYNCLESRALLSILELRKQFQEYNPNIIFSTQSYINNVVILAKLFSGSKARLIIREASIMRKYNSPIYWLSKLLYRFVDKIISQTIEIQQNLKIHYNVKPEKMQVIPNYIDHELLIKKSSLNLNEVPIKKHFTFIFCGRLHKVKNVDFLINTLAVIYEKSPRFEFWIIGDGEEREYLEELKCVKKLSFIKFFGLQLNPYPYMKEADCILLSSDYEGFPNVVIESMALNTVAVINNFKGGASSLIIPEVSKEFIYNNETEFIKVINGLLSLPQSEIDKVKQIFYTKSLDYSKKHLLNRFIN